ncbi:MAG: hypothetical protein M3160_03950 [Candidatus Eremiobacteraeota bacterium]|nr:hypothetical protein [Candidatus Eremiobacteraeota bacterium]
MKNAAVNRASAVTGPSINQVAAAAGSERAAGPLPQPQPNIATSRRPNAGDVAAIALPARINGILSNKVLAAVASAACAVAGGTVAIARTLQTSRGLRITVARKK